MLKGQGGGAFDWGAASTICDGVLFMEFDITKTEALLPAASAKLAFNWRSSMRMSGRRLPSGRMHFL